MKPWEQLQSKQQIQPEQEWTAMKHLEQLQTKQKI